MKYSILIFSTLLSFNIESQCLLTHYPLNGNANDISGNGHNATVNGASLTTDRFGNANNAYEFDGIDDFLDAGNIIDLSQETELTISAWFYSTNTSQTNRYCGVSFGTKLTGELMLRTGESVNQRFQAALTSGAFNSTSANANSMRSDTTYNLGQWYHLVGVYRNNQVELWVNGVLQNTPGSNGSGGNFNSILATAKLWIGKAEASTSDKFFKGKIDDIIIYRCAADSSLVDSLFNLANPLEISVTKASQLTSLYPNPVRDVLHIFYRGNEKYTYRIIDVSGKLLANKKNELSYNEEITVDFSGYNPGVYFLQIESKGGYMENYRIIKK